MDKETIYILGPGTTIKAITDILGLDKTLLGVDVLLDSKLISQDINEIKLLELIKDKKKAKIVITPIGGNGFIFGRGSKQISSKVLELVGKENIIVVSTLDKVGVLENLRVDTGDYEVDKKIGGKIDVIIGYNEIIVMEVKF